MNILTLFVFATFFNLTFAKETVEDRIKPVGSVYVAGEERDTSEKEDSNKKTAIDPQSIYEKNCKLCHAHGIAGAPKFQDKSAWKERLAKGLKASLEIVNKGKGAMPPKGTCMACSDEEFKAVIKYMSGQGK